MAERRPLRFENWDQVVADLRTLLESGYTATGKWNLEQMAKHLNDRVRFPVVGFPKQPLPIRVIAAVVRNTIGPGMLDKILNSATMPAGKPTPRSTVYESTSNDAVAVAELEKSIEQFRNYQGAIHPSPLFGAMDKSKAERLQLFHMSHHLSFLVPSSGQ